MKTMEIKSMRNGRHPAGTEGKAVRVDRKTAWGNPFPMRSEADRGKVCEQHRAWALKQVVAGKAPFTHAKLTELARAETLWCWCAPRNCHAETLRDLAQAAVRLTPGAFRNWAREQMQAG